MFVDGQLLLREAERSQDGLGIDQALEGNPLRGLKRHFRGNEVLVERLMGVDVPAVWDLDDDGDAGLFARDGAGSLLIGGYAELGRTAGTGQRPELSRR